MPAPTLTRGNRWLVALLLTFSVASGVLALPDVSSAASAPTVGPLSVKEVGAETSTAEVLVKPEGLRTEYVFWLQGPRHGWLCEPYPPCEPAELVDSGYIEASVPEATVSTHMTGLRSASYYTTWMTVQNTDGQVNTRPFTFETELPLPEMKINPYEREDSSGAWDEQSSKQQVEAVERERREAVERSTREASERRPATTPSLPQCGVPKLKGDTLRAAQRALRKAHCRLGRVHHSKHSRGRLAVSRQSPAAGVKLGNNAPVAVVLSVRPTRH